MKVFIIKNKKTLIKTTVVLAMVISWQIGSLYSPSIILPSPVETTIEFGKMFSSGELTQQLLQSLMRMLIGLSIGISIAIICGLLAGRYTVIYEALRPIYSLLLGIPPIILVVMAMIWFGTGATVPIFVVSILVFPVVYLNTADGWRNIDQQLIEMATIYKSPPMHTLRHIILPALSIPIISAISIAIGSSVRITIMAELLGSDSGIGYSLALARVNINTAKVFAWTITSVAIIIIIDHVIINPLRKFILRWRIKEG